MAPTLDVLVLFIFICERFSKFFFQLFDFRSAVRAAADVPQVRSYRGCVDGRLSRTS